jgi:hypothetical protein
MQRGIAYLSLTAAWIALFPCPPARAQPQPQPSAADASDRGPARRAKELFAAGRYLEAVEILAQLYAETNDPVFLRNIARCYQRLPDPDRAIASFEEYLLRGSAIIDTAERQQVRGFIRDMEELKKRTAAEKAPAAATPARLEIASPAPAAPPSAGLPPVTLPPSPAGSGAPAVHTRQAAAGRTVALASLGVAGALAIAGGATWAASWSRYNSAKEGCRARGTCNAAAKELERRIRLSKSFLIAAAASGALGAGIYFIGTGPREVAVAFGGRF